jgi:hypothetical protein
VHDIFIIECSLAVVKATFISMEKAAKEIELTVSENRTEFMALNDPAYSNLTQLYNLGAVAEFIYPGNLINCKNDLE